jgi:hypothetical protein
MSDTRLGSYQITIKLGEGGVDDRATDTGQIEMVSAENAGDGAPSKPSGRVLAFR